MHKPHLADQNTQEAFSALQSFQNSSCTRGSLYCDIYFVSLCNVSVEVAESFVFGKNISKPVCKNRAVANIVPKGKVSGNS